MPKGPRAREKGKPLVPSDGSAVTKHEPEDTAEPDMTGTRNRAVQDVGGTRIWLMGRGQGGDLGGLLCLPVKRRLRSSRAATVVRVGPGPGQPVQSGSGKVPSSRALLACIRSLPQCCGSAREYRLYRLRSACMVSYPIKMDIQFYHINGIFEGII